MSRFDHVSIVKHANIYANGAVTSRTVFFPAGSRKTLGIMLPGDYTFNTEQKEIMDIQSGRLDVLLPGSDTFTPVTAGQTFEVPARASFSMKVHEVTDYCCSYIDTAGPAKG
ncbi:pyrimidine/purine nucleoside phosphorylase [Desulfatiferula olefinivorans]